MPKEDASAAGYYNLFSEWSRSELEEFLREHGEPGPPRNTPLELLRARCADVAEEEANRQRRARAHAESRRPSLAPTTGNARSSVGSTTSARACS